MPLLEAQNAQIDKNKLEEFFSHYKSGQWIYPDAMHRALHLEYKDIYDILELCAKEKYLEHNIRLLCPLCHKYTGPVYKTLMDVPFEMGCDYDDQLIENPQKYMRVVYKVKDYEGL